MQTLPNICILCMAEFPDSKFIWMGGNVAILIEVPVYSVYNTGSYSDKNEVLHALQVNVGTNDDKITDMYTRYPASMLKFPTAAFGWYIPMPLISCTDIFR